ncbi:uncharacterized protein B0I36DRAFT_431682 [Microdochium trichocladiopsis]|uniref:AAA+ ATPase domain-containing protein n=1 Tax=Microdochium trichocladiopsis TaxID=1682393 RepID=A0A9P8Y8H1_9PEZI|nr:uncharacterized protein B0I36DRAFT_431682 [Microdochium trichocladiopsis]KAH7031628.1 hypothetical protein B0I36DRAFT_431682 [Microdochium trichocladiopsis]
MAQPPLSTGLGPAQGQPMTALPYTHPPPPPPPGWRPGQPPRKSTRRRTRRRRSSSTSSSGTFSSASTGVSTASLRAPGLGGSSRASTRSSSPAGSFREAVGDAEEKGTKFVKGLLQAIKALEFRVRQLEGSDGAKDANEDQVVKEDTREKDVVLDDETSVHPSAETVAKGLSSASAKQTPDLGGDSTLDPINTGSQEGEVGTGLDIDQSVLPKHDEEAVVETTAEEAGTHEAPAAPVGEHSNDVDDKPHVSDDGPAAKDRGEKMEEADHDDAKPPSSSKKERCKFELETQYFYRRDPEALRLYDSDDIYPLLRVKWDDIQNTPTSNVEAETQCRGVLQAGAVEVFEIRIESPVLKPYFDKLAGVTPSPEMPNRDGVVEQDHSIRFFKPFRWLIHSVETFREKVAELEQESKSPMEPLVVDATEPVPSEVSPGGAEEHDKAAESLSNPPDDVTAPETQIAAELSSTSHQQDQGSSVREADGPEHDLHAQLVLLLKTMDEYLATELSLYRQYREAKLPRIRFENIWMLFKPDDVMYTPSRSPGPKPRPDRVARPGNIIITKTGRPVPQAYKIVAVTGGRPVANPKPFQSKAANNTCLEIVVYYMDFDGLKFNSVTDIFVVAPFEGERDIVFFEGFPLNYVPSSAFNLRSEQGKTVEENLRARGMSFVRVCEVAHRLYEGLTVGPTKEEINTAVIIDFELAYQQMQSLIPRFSFPTPETLATGVIPPSPELHEAVARTRFGRAGGDWYWAHQNSLAEKSKSVCIDLINDYPAIDDPKTSHDDLIEQLDKQGHLLLLPGVVYGFALRNRKWVHLDVRLVQPIQLEAEWNDLVLPTGHKEMVRAVVENHATGSRPTKGGSKSSQEVDIVRGKGKGCIILLHGEPGVGKTSTAECVASYTKRPLFPITCGDIGYEPNEVESNLNRHFNLAHKWGCVMLLDEADVFLARRSRDDVKRNGLVSVFLRVLEYYPGILFLTTNRVGAFDDAFRSRIHLSLYYPKLDRRQTIQIWKMNLRRVTESNAKRVQDGQPELKVQHDKIIRFVKDHWEQLNWNGRQIRNAFQTAIALSEFDVRDVASAMQASSASRAQDSEIAGQTGPQAAGKDEVVAEPDGPAAPDNTQDVPATISVKDANGKKAKRKQPVMSTKQFKTIARASMQFDNYLFHTHGRSDEATNARKEQIRWDYEVKEHRDAAKFKVDLASSSTSESGSDSDSDSASGSGSSATSSGRSDVGSSSASDDDQSDGSDAERGSDDSDLESESDDNDRRRKGKSKSKKGKKSSSSKKRVLVKDKSKESKSSSRKKDKDKSDRGASGKKSKTKKDKN